MELRHRLTLEQAREIREKYEPGKAGPNSIRGLAEQYGVGRTTIHKILRNERYKEEVADEVTS